MFESMQSILPTEWQGALEFWGTPLWWIPAWQEMVVQLSMWGGTPMDSALRRVFLLFPGLVVIVGMWVTMASLYTLPFRSERGRFLTVIAMSWWDAGRSIWFFWAGVLRVAVVLVGWVWGLIKLAVRMIVRLLTGTFNSPFVLLDWTSRRYFKPGVPWIAFLLTLAWSALEATIFTYTLQATLNEVLADITGFEPNRAIVTPIVFSFLFLLIAGSFACVQVLTEALNSRKVGQILQMLFVEFFVMFFEVVFLYRELIDAITPWIAAQTGGAVQLGLIPTLSPAAFGWVGIRGMTWFLFGRYGTPALLAVLSRETITQDEAIVEPRPELQPVVYGDAIKALKDETAWFKKEARYVFQLLTLPILQLFAAALNFPVVAIRSEPVFRLPFESLDDVLASTPFAPAAKQAAPRSRSAPQPSAPRSDAPSPGGTL